MFKEMRRSDREIGGDELKKILENGEYGVLATIGENGYPYTTPISYVYHDDVLYFHCAVEGSKLDNIKSNEKISFCVVGKTNVLQSKFSTEYESVIVFGRAYITKNEEKKDALIAIAEKYSPDFKVEGLQYIDRAINNTCVIKIEVDKLSGKARR